MEKQDSGEIRADEEAYDNYGKYDLDDSFCHF